MFAIFKSGNSQYKAEIGKKLILQKIDSDLGKEIIFDKVCLLSDYDGINYIGEPWVEGAKVICKVTRQYKDKKVNIIKFKRRKHHIKHQGHRQQLTELEVFVIKK